MKKISLLSFLFVALSLFVSVFASAQNLDANANYYIRGNNVGPWQFALQFGQVELQDKNAKTAKGSLIAKPAKKNSIGDALRLTWNPKGIKNEWGSENKNVLTATLTNSQWHTDLSSVVNGAALSFDIRVIKPPKKVVELTMESAWNWQQRSTIPLKNVLRRLPKKKWTTVPIPLKCFDNGKLDFSKITTSFMLYSQGKMDIEIGDIRLTAFPADKVKC
ncbi:hypothetical protein C2869_00505 [Saccharobesus litoralis]|uniref:ExoP galactose-binding-like domain-containing protein n=1 Tax=Saccharobesus litoralis TaxID=2172099 RepID=A0A2S0VLC8_9ALTE|nr:putative glycoside hydrolase [Saccharobesus litoralis]AWB65012.1 hypothetical protein C2869_00505 [Saccharobesus litoralis]